MFFSSSFFSLFLRCIFPQFFWKRKKDNPFNCKFSFPFLFVIFNHFAKHVESRIGKKEKERTLKNHLIKGEASLGY